MNVVELGGGAPLETRIAVGCGLCRSLHRRGWRVAPLMPAGASTASDGRAPLGGVSRLTAMLSEASGVHPEPAFEVSPGKVEAALEALSHFDFVIAFEPSGRTACQRLLVENQGTGLRLLFGEADFELPEPPALDVFPRWDEELARLPAYRPGRPRVGIVSLPALENFAAYTGIPGAEWIAGVLPGSFDAILLPESGDSGLAVAWLAETGLSDWLMTQKLTGCRLIGFGDTYGGIARLEEAGAAADYRRLSKLLEARMPVPLPGEDEFDLLGDYWERAVCMDDLETRLLRGPGIIVK